jgi:anti-anti-sigma factor
MSPHPHPLLHVKEGETVTRVTVAAENLDEDNLQDIRAGLLAIADGLTRRVLELDMGRVRYLTSTGLGQLVAVHNRLRDLGRSLAVVNVSPRVHELFTVTRLTRVLDIRTAAAAGFGWPEAAPLAPEAHR